MIDGLVSVERTFDGIFHTIVIDDGTTEWYVSQIDGYWYDSSSDERVSDDMQSALTVAAIRALDPQTASDSDVESCS